MDTCDSHFGGTTSKVSGALRGHTLEDTSLTDKTLLAAERYRTVPGISNATISNLTEDALFRAISSAVKPVIPHDRSAIFFSDSDKNILRLFAIDWAVVSSSLTNEIG